MIKVNGKLIPYTDGMTLDDFVTQNGYDRSKIAIEMNNQIIPKAKYADSKIEDECVIEVVTFVGGG